MHKVSLLQILITAIFLGISCDHFYSSETKRTNIGLADTLIPSSFISFMGATGPCDSSKTTFGNHVYIVDSIQSYIFNLV